MKELLLWLLGRRRRVEVSGESMLPHLKPGDQLFVDEAAYQSRPPQIDDLVVLKHPNDSELLLVKRVTFVDDEGKLFLAGDNPNASSDSRQFGIVSPDKLIGRVSSRFG